MGWTNAVRLEGILTNVDYFPPDRKKPEFASIMVSNDYGFFEAIVFGHRAKFVDGCFQKEPAAKWRILGRLINNHWTDRHNTAHVSTSVNVIQIDPIIFEDTEVDYFTEECEKYEEDDDDG